MQWVRILVPDVANFVGNAVATAEREEARVVVKAEQEQLTTP